MTAAEAAPAAEPFIDCHVHCWDPTRFSYPVLAGAGLEDLPERFVPADLVAAAGDRLPSAAVHIQAEVDHATDPVAETAWLQAALDDPDTPAIPTAHVAYADLAAPDAAETLDRHLEHPIVRGIRQEVWWEERPSRPDFAAVDLLALPAWQAGYALLGPRGLTFDLTCFVHQLDQAAAFVAHHAEVPVVIDHLGSPDVTDADGLASWRRSLDGFAGLDHVVMKLSGVTQAQGYSADWTVDAVRPVFEAALEAFGTGRCVLGTNFPIATLAGATYPQVRDALDALIAGLSPDEQADLRHRTAARVYRIDLGPAPG